MQRILKTFLLILSAAALYAFIAEYSGETAGTSPVTGSDSVLQKRTCGTMNYLEQTYKNDPQYQKILEDLDKSAVEFSKTHASRDLSLVTIPVVVHVVYSISSQNISYDQIRTQIDVLNRDYRRLNRDTANTPPAFKPVASDPMIQFCLAQRDPSGNPSLGVTRTLTTVQTFGLDDAVKFSSMGGHDAWDRNKYLNIWVCNLGSNLLGYATFPGGNPATDGVVIGYLYFGTIGTATPPYHLGRTATHEVGHWLQLYHIWGDDNGACTGSDLVADTPNQGAENYGCPGFPHISCNNGPNGDMFMNYMDYTDDGCMNIFTNGQSVRMSSALNGPRAPILTSNGCTSVNGTPIAMFVADSTSIVHGRTVQFTDLSAGIPTGWSWDFSGGTPSSSNIQNPSVVYNAAGLYSVKLTVTNSFGTDTLTRISYIRVMGTPMSAFTLVSPPSLTRITTSPADTSLVRFTWTRAAYAPDVTYKLKLRKLGAPNDLIYTSNNSGLDSAITFRNSYLDTLANNLGITGDSVKCFWRVYAYNGVDSTASSATNFITFVRSVIGVQNISTGIPVKFALYNNYPNPFNPATNIKFDIAKRQKVNITLYDVIGRVAAVLVNETLEPGTYEAKWDASGFASGIYYYRMQTGEFSDTKKMVLIK